MVDCSSICGYRPSRVLAKALCFSACSVIACELSVTATFPLPPRKLPIRSAAREPLARVSIETTAKRPVFGASVATQTTGMLLRDARHIHECKLCGRLGKVMIPSTPALSAPRKLLLRPPPGEDRFDTQSPRSP